MQNADEMMRDIDFLYELICNYFICKDVFSKYDGDDKNASQNVN